MGIDGGSYLKGRAMPNRKAGQPWNGGKTTNSSSWGSSLPANLRALSAIPAEINFDRMGEVPVLVSVANADLADFSHRVYQELEAKLIVVGGNMPPEISEEVLLKYFATAIYSRVMWVNHTTTPRSFRPDEPWSLPVPMSYVIAAIGRVETEDGPVYVPTWNPEGDQYVLSREEWEQVTRRLRALEPYGLRFVKAYEKDSTGVSDVMSLLRLETPDGEYFFGQVPPHAFECICALIAGLSPVAPVQMPNHPALLPRYRLRSQWVVSWMHDFASLSDQRDVV